MAGLKEKIIRAHGGHNGRWHEVGEVLTCATMGGWDFTSRMQPRPLRDVEVAASTQEGKVTLTPFLNPDAIGVFRPDRVAILDADGKCLAERDDPAGSLRSWRRFLGWDELDVLYYAGLLLWQSLNLPFLIMRSGIECEELSPVDLGGERWHRLAVRYPEDFPSIADEQILFCDGAGLVHRVDYAPAAHSAWLCVTQLWAGHESFSGLVYPTRQTTHPRLLSGQVLRLSTLVWLELDDFNIVAKRRAREL